MANRIKYGFRWVRSLIDGDGEPPMQRVRLATGVTFSAGGTAVDLQPGDPMTQSADGVWALAAAGGLIQGVCAGIAPYWDGSKMVYNTYFPASTAYATNYDRESFIYVIPCAGQLFEVGANIADGTSAGGTIPSTYATWIALIGENCDHTYADADSTARKAYPQLDVGTRNTTTFGWRVVEIPGINDPEFAQYDLTLKNVPVRVTVNETSQAPYYTTGI